MQDASGNALSDQSLVISHYTFTGRRPDAETGLYYYRNRYYSADLGRFLSTDPLDYVDGMNMYAYVVGNPVNFFDPWGLAVTEADKRKYFPWLAASADAKARGDNWTSVGLAIAGAGRAVVWDQWRFIFSEGGEAMHEVHVQQTLAYQNGELTAAEYSAYRIAKPFADFAMAPHMITGAVLTDPVSTGKALVTAPKTIAESFGTNAGEYFYGDGDLVSIFDTGEDALALLLLTRAGQVGITRSADVIRNVAPAVLRDGDVAISQALRIMPGGRMMNDAIYPNIVQDGLKGLASNAKSTRRTYELPAWLRERFAQGNEFNRVQRKNYRYNELELIGSRRNPVVDSYDPLKGSGGEIISRKFTQFSRITERTAISYLNELVSSTLLTPEFFGSFLSSGG